MALFVNGTRQLHAELQNGLVVAVDLGFAEQDETCGIAWRKSAGDETARPSTFGKCIEEIATLVSATFTLGGNPVARSYDGALPEERSFESGRGWYYGAGASVALGALFFLRGLREALAASATTLVLYEGFVSFKRTKTAHTDDARQLLRAFVGGERGDYQVCAPSGGKLVTALDVLGEPAEGAPLVLIPSRAETE